LTVTEIGPRPTARTRPNKLLLIAPTILYAYQFKAIYNSANLSFGAIGGLLVFGVSPNSLIVT